MPAEHRPRSPAVRLLIVVLSLLAAGWASFAGAFWRTEIDRLANGLEAAAGVHEEAVLDVRREDVVHQAKLVAARALIGAVLDHERLEDGQLTVDPEIRAHLPIARDLAREALEAHPNSWQAAMWLGAAHYLEAWYARDPALISDADRWQKPLLAAYDNAGGRREAERLLAVAYLRLWPYLGPDRRAFARDLVRDTFAAHPEVFKQLGPLWLAVASGRDEALSVVPDTPEAWRLVSKIWAEQGRWRWVRQAELGRQASLERALEARIDEAEERRALGEAYESRSLYLGAVVRAPVDGRFAALVVRALANYPPGLHGLSSTGPLNEWLRWAMELGELGYQALPDNVLERLAAATSDLEAHESALIALLADDLPRAERAERLVETRSTTVWRTYLILKAHHFLDLERVDEAEAALDEIGRYSRVGAPYWLVRERLAIARGDLAGRAEAQQALTELRRERWSADAWQNLETRAVLRLLPTRAANQLVIELVSVPKLGGLAQIRLDGTTIELAPVSPSDRQLVIDVELDTELHQLEVMAAAGGRVVPGDVWLRDLPGLSPRTRD